MTSGRSGSSPFFLPFWCPIFGRTIGEQPDPPSRHAVTLCDRRPVGPRTAALTQGWIGERCWGGRARHDPRVAHPPDQKLRSGANLLDVPHRVGTEQAGDESGVRSGQHGDVAAVTTHGRVHVTRQQKLAATGNPQLGGFGTTHPCSGRPTDPPFARDASTR